MAWVLRCSRLSTRRPLRHPLKQPGPQPQVRQSARRPPQAPILLQHLLPPQRQLLHLTLPHLETSRLPQRVVPAHPTVKQKVVKQKVAVGVMKMKTCTDSPHDEAKRGGTLGLKHLVPRGVRVRAYVVILSRVSHSKRQGAMRLIRVQSSLMDVSIPR